MNDQTASPGKGNLSPLLQLVYARLREFVRQPEAVFWVYFFPLLMVVVLGIAFRNQPIETFQVDVVQDSRLDQFAKLLDDDKQFIVERFSRKQSRQRLRTGKTGLVLDVNKDGDEKPFVYSFDPSRPGSLVAKERVDAAIQRDAGWKDPPVKIAEQTQTEPGGRYVDFLVPGLLGMGLLGGGLWGVGFAIVDMRIRKSLKLFLATPMRKTDFLIGIMISRLLFMVPEMVLLLVFSHYVFGVVIYGNIIAVVFLVLFGSILFSGLGLLIASRAKTLETVSGLMNLTMLPMWTLSGVFFSYETFPEAFHPFIKALPLTAVIDALRGVMLEGRSIFELWVELLIMLAWSIGTFVIALRIFRWRD